MPPAVIKSASLSNDITIVLQHLITDELDNLISTVLLASNGIFCKDAETSQKHPKGLLFVDKEHKRKSSHICLRNQIENEQGSQSCILCKQNEENERRHKNDLITQGDSSVNVTFQLSSRASSIYFKKLLFLHL